MKTILFLLAITTNTLTFAQTIRNEAWGLKCTPSSDPTCRNFNETESRRAYDQRQTNRRLDAMIDAQREQTQRMEIHQQRQEVELYRHQQAERYRRGDERRTAEAIREAGRTY